MFGISRNTILVVLVSVLVLCGSTFLGYCVGWTQGYDQGSKVVMYFYTQSNIDKNNKSKELAND
jgi:hypothetical protein